MAAQEKPYVQAQSTADDDVEDAAAKGEYHFLDVGDEKYGECTLVIFGDVRILIDGSHQGDFNGSDGHDSVPDQLAAILQEEAPHSISLLVVTHGHHDHIGCLPALVSNGVIEAEWAFITDPKLGFGRTSSDALPTDALDNPRYRLAAALREEDASDLSDAKLRDFLADATGVETRYAAFIKGLKKQGTEIVFYKGQPLPAKLAKLLKPTGAKLLGPSEAQLRFCAEQIGKTNEDAMNAADALLQVDASMDDVALYRAAVERGNLIADAAGSGRGNGMNCQSITFAFGPKTARVLLAGDMQFTEPGVKGADDEMSQLRKKVAAAGPYKLFKTTHHSSHNGQDDDWLTELGDPPIIVHSGGLNDASHPFPGVLKMLKARGGQIRFARTDRNGHITVRPHLDPAEAIEKSRGRFNDFSDNVKDMESEAGTELPATPQTTSGVAAAGAGGNPQIIIVNLPAGPIDMTVGGVDIVVRGKAVSIAGTDKPGKKTPPQPRTPRPVDFTVSLGGGRELPNLLFVTNAPRLAANIGRAESEAALEAIRKAGRQIYEVDGSAAQASDAVRAVLRSRPGIEGVVLLGGYDVVPSNVVDVLSDDLRAELGPNTVAVDEDHFLVWSDEAYGDTDGDRIAERPVSRIPDGRNAALFLGALGSRGIATATQKFGVRNLARPFASTVWKCLAGNRALDVSERFLTTDVTPDLMTSSQLHYFMLHGDWQDARTFYGELADQTGYTNAFAVGNVPKRFDGVAFSGCCWGALTVSQKARDAGAAPLAPRVAERSIALMYLQAGASAFVGCTGSHYSGPDPDPDANYASRMHSAFWTALPQGRYSPAMALHRARNDYAASVAAGAAEMEPIELAWRLKNRAQFTCLGLGW
nr:hypothetical protein [uncultured Dongia sp.]